MKGYKQKEEKGDYQERMESFACHLAVSLEAFNDLRRPLSWADLCALIVASLANEGTLLQMRMCTWSVRHLGERLLELADLCDEKETASEEIFRHINDYRERKFFVY